MSDGFFVVFLFTEGISKLIVGYSLNVAALVQHQPVTEKGYYAVRMGSVVKDLLDTSNGMIIDYATNGSRTEFLDIYLGAKCRFFIGSAAGITELPKVFRRPILSVNQLPLEWTHSWGPQDIFIPKKIWLRSEARFLTYLEILTSGIGTGVNGNQYSEAGADPIENTPEEIASAVLEMEARLSGEWSGVYSHKNVLGSLMSLQLLCAACLFLQGWHRLLTGAQVHLTGDLALGDVEAGLLVCVVLPQNRFLVRADQPHHPVQLEPTVGKADHVRTQRLLYLLL